MQGRERKRSGASLTDNNIAEDAPSSQIYELFNCRSNNRFYSSQLAVVVIYRLGRDPALVSRGERKCAAVRGNIGKPADKLAIEVDISLPAGIWGLLISDAIVLVLGKTLLKAFCQVQGLWHHL